jgi:hypothetical protein
MGVIRGVNPGNEPKTKDYLHGQLWNRPKKDQRFEWLIFETTLDYYYADRFGFAGTGLYLLGDPIYVYKNVDENGDRIVGEPPQAGLSIIFAGVQGYLSGGSMVQGRVIETGLVYDLPFYGSANREADLTRPGGAVVFRAGIRIDDMVDAVALQVPPASIVRFDLVGSWAISDSLALGGNTSIAYLSPDFDAPSNLFDFGTSRVEKYPLLWRHTSVPDVLNITQDVAYFDFDAVSPTESTGFTSVAIDLADFAQGGSSNVDAYQLYPGIVYDSSGALS